MEKNMLGQAHERIDELEGERDRLLASVATLREALVEAKCYIGMYRNEHEAVYGPCSESDTAEIDKDVRLCEAALTNPGAVDALERVRREAKIEALSALAVHQRVRIVPQSRSEHNATTETYVRWDAISARIAALRGGE